MPMQKAAANPAHLLRCLRQLSITKTSSVYRHAQRHCCSTSALGMTAKTTVILRLLGRQSAQEVGLHATRSSRRSLNWKTLDLLLERGRVVVHSATSSLLVFSLLMTVMESWMLRRQKRHQAIGGKIILSNPNLHQNSPAFSVTNRENGRNRTRCNPYLVYVDTVCGVSCNPHLVHLSRSTIRL